MKLVTIEGIDGSGKSTIFRDLNNLMGEDNIKFEKFPGDLFFKYYNKNMSDIEIENLQQLDKKSIYENNRNLGTDILVGDRGEVSQIVYNGTESPSVRSDLVIYLNIKLENALKRINNRKIEDNLGYESEDILKEKIDRYREVLNSNFYKNKVIEYKIIKDLYYFEGRELNYIDILESIKSHILKLKGEF